MVEVQPKTVAVYADLGCPWAHVAVFRLHSTRARLGLDKEVRFDVRAFPLELVNGQPTPKRILDAEIPVAGALEPAAGWQMWQRPLYEFPVTTLPALEAVEAAKEQGLRASETLDKALRVAFFGGSRCISMRDEILDVASSCDGVDPASLEKSLDHGTARPAVIEQWHLADASEVEGSPHLFLAGGANLYNPGIEMHWEGPHGEGFPVVDADYPDIYEDLLRKAAR